MALLHVRCVQTTITTGCFILIIDERLVIPTLSNTRMQSSGAARRRQEEGQDKGGYQKVTVPRSDHDVGDGRGPEALPVCILQVLDESSAPMHARRGLLFSPRCDSDEHQQHSDEGGDDPVPIPVSVHFAHPPRSLRQRLGSVS